MHPSERNRLIRDLRRLKLAAADMGLAGEAVDALLTNRYASAPRVLETGLLTVYARSFKSSGRRWARFKAEWTPTDPEELAVHDSILKQRDKRHAHTDEKESGREIVDVFGTHFYSEEYPTLTADALQKIAALAQSPTERFKDAADEIEYQLGRARDIGGVAISDWRL